MRAQNTTGTGSPPDLEAELTFLAMVRQVLRRSERVLRFYGITPQFQTTVDLNPLTRMLSTLCVEQRKAPGGLDELRRMQQLVERVPRRDVPADGFVQGH